MLDVLADSYKIAARTDTWELRRAPAPRREADKLTPKSVVAAPKRKQAALLIPLRWLAGWVKQRVERSRARSAALRMSEHQLRDIGLSRYDLLMAIDEGYRR